MYRYRSNLYRYRFGSGGVYRYRFKVYRYMSPKNAQNVCFSPIFPYVDTQINPILHKHVKTTPNSSYNLFSTQIIIQYISFFKTFHDFLPKTILIWVITHTLTKYKNLLGFVLTQTPLLCNQTMNPTSKGGFHVFLVPFGVLPTLLSIIFGL